MRTTSLLIASAVTASLLVAPAAGSAGAARAMCQGEEATVVVKKGKATGKVTEGPDVIVTDASLKTFAGAGDDTMCLRGMSSTQHVNLVGAGSGDDSVTVESSHYPVVYIQLEDGNDTFVGGPGRDEIRTIRDDGEDSVTTGGGDDFVKVAHVDGESLSAGDAFALGAGQDHIELHPRTVLDPGVLDGGGGFDSINVIDRLNSPYPNRAEIDVVDQVLLTDGVPRAAWESVEGVWATHFSRVLYRGSAGNDYLKVVDTGFVDVTMGAGDDVFWTAQEDRHDPPNGLASGETGSDTVGEFNVETSPRTINLVLGRIDDTDDFEGTDQDDYSTSIDGFENASTVTRTLGTTIIGTDGPNVIGASCDTRVLAGGGADTLYWAIDGNCGVFGVDANGGDGPDRLVGGSSADDLRGGPGKDVAVGGTGIDVCRAEVTSGCEH